MPASDAVTRAHAPIGEGRNGEATEEIIAADPVDLLRAVPATTMVDAAFDCEPACPEVYRAGRCVATHEQPEGTDVLDWLRETAPQQDLPGPRLPHGHPVCLSSAIHRYGYRSSGTDR
ncbi:hypothetical protein [Streptomyces sp. NPDC053427]|uniref:hypothetical protein n=1 Tax=Streptomyces sp. NPDC053427 TaxID=3365701 RepID=UPI0037CCD450